MSGCQFYEPMGVHLVEHALRGGQAVVDLLWRDGTACRACLLHARELAAAHPGARWFWLTTLVAPPFDARPENP